MVYFDFSLLHFHLSMTLLLRKLWENIKSLKQLSIGNSPFCKIMYSFLKLLCYYTINNLISRIGVKYLSCKKLLFLAASHCLAGSDRTCLAGINKDKDGNVSSEHSIQKENTEVKVCAYLPSNIHCTLTVFSTFSTWMAVKAIL